MTHEPRLSWPRLVLVLLVVPFGALACSRSERAAAPAGERASAGPAATVASPDPALVPPVPSLAPAPLPAPAHPGPGLAERVEQAARAAAPSEKERRAKTVALVNGEAITVGDLERRLAAMHGEAPAGPRGRFDPGRLMFRVVNDLLLAQEARTLGMDQEDPTRGQVERFLEEESLREMERAEILAKARVTDPEVRSAFAEHYRRISLRVVTVDREEDAAAILTRITAGGDMAALAKERSLDPYAPRGGLAAGLARRDLAPEVGALAASLRLGEIGGPVMTDLGWSVIRVEGLLEADPAGLEKARPILRDLLSLEKTRALRAALAARLQKKHAVTVDQEVVRAIVPRRLPDGRLAPDVGDPAAVVVRVAGQAALTAGDYGDALLLRWSGVRSEDAARAASPIILSGLIERSLLLAEARALGYARRPDVRRAARDYETRLLVQRYLEEVVGRTIAIGPDELQAYYDAHRQEFRKPPRLDVGQITVATREEAAEVASLLKQGTDLAWLARKRSTDRFAASGGARGPMVPQPGADEMNDTLARAVAGDVVGPIGQPGNFTILKVIARQEQGTYDFKDVSGNVRSAVFSEKFGKALDELVSRLRDRARVDVRESVLASLRFRGTVDEGPGAGSPPRDGAH